VTGIPASGGSGGSKRGDMKILASAYACNPEGSLQMHPGEDLTGWCLVQQLGRFHDVYVLTHSRNEKGIQIFLQGRPLPGVRFVFLDLPKGLKWLYRIEFGQRIYYFLWQIKAWQRARELDKEIHFDLAHHVTFGNDWIPSFIGAFLSIPFIWGPVGGGQRTPRPLLREYTCYGRFAEAIRNAAQWFGRRMFVRRLCLKRARALLVCNPETYAKIPFRYKDKTLYFPVNGISAQDVWARPPGPRAGPPFKVITAGRLHRLKGFSLAVRAFASFAADHPDSEMEIIGKGPEEGRLRRLIQKAGLQGKVQIVPWLPRKDVLDAMRSSDVFLFPSFRDGGGAVVVEAMASSLPIIVLDSGGPGAHIHEEWGIKISPGPPDEVVRKMAQALERLSRNKELRHQMGRAGRERVLSFYLWDRLGEKMRETYTFALEGKRPSDEGMTE